MNLFTHCCACLRQWTWSRPQLVQTPSSSGENQCWWWTYAMEYEYSRNSLEVKIPRNQKIKKNQKKTEIQKIKKNQKNSKIQKIKFQKIKIPRLPQDPKRTEYRTLSTRIPCLCSKPWKIRIRGQWRRLWNAELEVQTPHVFQLKKKLPLSNYS